MAHLSEDEILLVAFGDQPSPPHLADCRSCAASLHSARELMKLGQQTASVRDLPKPPEHVWQAIAAQATAVPQVRRRWSWTRPRLVVAAAATVLAAVAAAGIWRGFAPDVTASTTLAAVKQNAPAASGSAKVIGQERLQLKVQGLPKVDGYFEVWLIDPGSLEMVSIGVLGSAPDATFTLPGNINLTKYRLVDVSAERYDNNAAHSGNSLLRGVLS